MKKRDNPPDTTSIDMPEVKDIPGQEHVKPPRIREMEDTTASSAGEEGVGIVDDLNKDEETSILDDASNVTEEERKLLAQTERQTNAETEDLKKLSLDSIDDNTDAELGDPEDMGADLDVPGSELDDDNEEIGEEDEENNSYSLPD